jgi:hypothetical protein
VVAGVRAVEQERAEEDEEHAGDDGTTAPHGCRIIGGRPNEITTRNRLSNAASDLTRPAWHSLVYTGGDRFEPQE